MELYEEGWNLLIRSGPPKMAKAINYSISDIEAWKRGEQTGLDTRVVHALNDEHSILGILLSVPVNTLNVPPG